MSETILSAGIDIGTTTTQLVFSRLFMENTSNVGEVPRIEIVKKEILYRSPIYFTPLLNEEEIDMDKVIEIIQKEYETAGMTPKEFATGAVIITGETSRKRNARQVVHTLSQIAGDFVVATAGPNLEGILAGKGSGAAKLSEITGKLVANLDIGGGTTNICYFQDGIVVDTACLDIGGRLIRIFDHKIEYISPKMKEFLKYHHIDLEIGELVTTQNEKCKDKFELIARHMVKILEQSVLLSPASEELDMMKTNQLISCNRIPEIITFSGGVADCISNQSEFSFPYGDIGLILGNAVGQSTLFSKFRHKEFLETMNATVIGAGNYSMEVSGSTIEHQNFPFPMKNIPVVSFSIDHNHLSLIHSNIELAIERFCEKDGNLVQFALAAKGLSCPSFVEIELMAQQIVLGVKRVRDSGFRLILVLEEDMGKALGQAIKRLLSKKEPFVCIDHISCREGDYIDLGEPVALGKVIPVVVKTLIFNS